MTSSLIFASAASSGGTTAFLIQMAPLLLIFVVFYVLLIRPQQNRMKLHAAKIAGAKRGDMVVTGGGLIGKVTKVDETEIEIEIASGVKVKAVKTTLSDVLTPTVKPAND